MSAELIAQILKAALLIWLALMLVAVVAHLMRSGIALRGVLANDPNRAKTEMTGKRVIAVLMLPVVIMFMIMSALNFDPGAVAPGVRPSLPDIPDNLLVLLAGGNGLYLADKVSAKRNGAKQ